MPACSVCLVTLSLSEAGPGRFGCQSSVTDICRAMPYNAVIVLNVNAQFKKKKRFVWLQVWWCSGGILPALFGVLSSFFDQ